MFIFIEKQLFKSYFIFCLYADEIPLSPDFPSVCIVWTLERSELKQQQQKKTNKQSLYVFSCIMLTSSIYL